MTIEEAREKHKAEVERYNANRPPEAEDAELIQSALDLIGAYQAAGDAWIGTINTHNGEIDPMWKTSNERTPIPYSASFVLPRYDHAISSMIKSGNKYGYSIEAISFIEKMVNEIGDVITWGDLP